MGGTWTGEHVRNRTDTPTVKELFVTQLTFRETVTPSHKESPEVVTYELETFGPQIKED